MSAAVNPHAEGRRLGNVLSSQCGPSRVAHSSHGAPVGVILVEEGRDMTVEIADAPVRRINVPRGRREGIFW